GWTCQVPCRLHDGPADEHEKNLLLDRRADDFDLQSPRYADQNRCTKTTHLGLSAGRRSERFGSAFFKWDELKIDAVFLEDTLLHTKNDVHVLGVEAGGNETDLGKWRGCRDPILGLSTCAFRWLANEPYRRHCRRLEQK